VCLGRNRENRTGRVSCCVLLAKYYWGDQFKKDDMDGTCGRHGGEEKHTGFWWARLENDDGRITFKLI
jgi:hypothetical protein